MSKILIKIFVNNKLFDTKIFTSFEEFSNWYGWTVDKKLVKYLLPKSNKNKIEIYQIYENGNRILLSTWNYGREIV